MSTENRQTYKQGFWKEHSEAWKDSGLTQVTYCSQQGISHRSFVYQHNRIFHHTTKSPINFIEAKPEPVTVNNQITGVQLMLPNGVRIGIANEVNPILLKTVLTIVGALPC